MPDNALPQLELVGKQLGFRPDASRSAVLFRLNTEAVNPPSASGLSFKVDFLIKALQLHSVPPVLDPDGPDSDPWQAASITAMAIVSQLQTRLRLTLPDQPRCRRLEPDSYLLVQPSTEYSLQATATLLQLCLSTLLRDDREPVQLALVSRMQQCAAGLKAALPETTNTFAFLSAAQELDIPVEPLTTTLYRFGWGKASVLMDSSLTEYTPAIACSAARNKLISKSMLKRAGIPVVDAVLVSTPAQAWDAAQKLGGAVVVKPQDADGGLEVHVNLASRDEVEVAAQAVIASRHPVLVERFFPGRDYRIQVFQGAVFRCIERRPGGVIGDGVSSIQTLLDQLNSEPDRGPSGTGKLKCLIDYDLDAERTLTKQGLCLDSVPSPGCFVALRSIANVSRGGAMTDVLDEAHPDNLDLAIRASEALRLDLAGVDLLMSDIRRSWLDVGAVICEVNAQPQIATRHGFILQQLLKGDGRIPVDVIVGLDQISDLHARLSSFPSCASGPGIGLVGREGVFLDGQLLLRSPTNQFQAISMLFGSPRVGRLIVALWDATVLESGLPIDRFRRLIAYSAVVEDRQQPDAAPAMLATEFAKQFRPMAESLHSVISMDQLLSVLCEGS